VEITRRFTSALFAEPSTVMNAAINSVQTAAVISEPRLDAVIPGSRKIKITRKGLEYGQD